MSRGEWQVSHNGLSFEYDEGVTPSNEVRLHSPVGVMVTRASAGDRGVTARGRVASLQETSHEQAASVAGYPFFGTRLESAQFLVREDRLPAHSKGIREAIRRAELSIGRADAAPAVAEHPQPNGYSALTGGT